MYRDAASYLAEWIEFHRLVGAERFFLYDNGSVDEHREVLAPYIEEGIVVVHDWPMPFIGRRGGGGALQRGFDHCLATHREDSRWIAFLDVDEFLFSPTGALLPELLTEYEEFAAVCVSRAEFGTSGHRTRPDGLVIDNFVHRRPVRPDEYVPVKSIVDPRKAVLSRGAHTFDYLQGLAVDENRRPVDQLDGYGRKPVSWSKFRIHHYGSKSEEEGERKTRQWHSMGTRRGANATSAGPQGELDETLTAYAQPVCEAIEQARVR